MFLFPLESRHVGISYLLQNSGLFVCQDFFLFQNFCLFEKLRLNNATLINLRLMAPLQRRQGRLPGGNDESIAFVVCSIFVCPFLDPVLKGH